MGGGGQRGGTATPQVLEQPSPALATFLAKLRGQTYDSDAPSSTAFQEVEQEREVAHEVEAIRKVQKPILYEALPYRGLHEDVLLFEKTGRPKPASTAYCAISLAVRRTQTGQRHDAAAAALFHHQLFASTEVFRTVKLDKPDDTFLRPVTWLLWSTHTQTALIVTPEEAEDLLARKRRASDDRPLTHLLAYAAPVTRRMATYFNKLDYYAVPPLPAGYAAPRWLPIQLGLFAGRLYFEFDEYDTVAAALLHGGNGSAHGGQAAVEWGSVHRRDSAISSSVGHGAALAFLQEWITVRRKGQDFSQTPMGFVCEGKALGAGHPFFSRAGDGDFLRESSQVLREDSAQESCNSDLDDRCRGLEVVESRALLVAMPCRMRDALLNRLCAWKSR